MHMHVNYLYSWPCVTKNLHIKVPDNESRAPKSIEDGHWKG